MPMHKQKVNDFPMQHAIYEIAESADENAENRRQSHTIRILISSEEHEQRRHRHYGRKQKEGLTERSWRLREQTKRRSSIALMGNMKIGIDHGDLLMQSQRVRNQPFRRLIKNDNDANNRTNEDCFLLHKIRVKLAILWRFPLHPQR